MLRLAVFVALVLCAAADQRECTRQFRNFMIHIASGTECLGSTCSPPCQAIIDATMNACAGMLVPNTREAFDPIGIASMRDAVNMDSPSNCDWTCHSCNSGAGTRRLMQSGSSFARPKEPIENSAENAFRQQPGNTAEDQAAKKQPAQASTPTTHKLEGCVDKMKSCAEWADAGECAVNEAFMLVECCDSCLKHTQDHNESDTCKDSHPECAHWAADGECAANAAFMLPSCCKSCVRRLAAALEKPTQQTATQ